MSASRLSAPRLALTQQEAAEALGVSVDAFAAHVKPYVRTVFVGARRLYPVAGIEEWLDDQAVQHGRKVA